MESRLRELYEYMYEHRELVDEIVFHVLFHSSVTGRGGSRIFKNLSIGKFSDPRILVRHDGILDSDGVYGAPPDHPEVNKHIEWTVTAKLHENGLMPRIFYGDEMDTFYAYSMSADLAFELYPFNIVTIQREDPLTGKLKPNSYEYKVVQKTDEEKRLKLYEKLKKFPRKKSQKDLIKIDEIVSRLILNDQKNSFLRSSDY